MSMSKNYLFTMLEKTVRDYYLIKEYEENGLLVKINGWYEAKSEEAANPLYSFLVSARNGKDKGSFKIKLPSKKKIEQYENIIRVNKN